jgi:hypothetical protein
MVARAPGVLKVAAALTAAVALVHKEAHPEVR